MDTYNKVFIYGLTLVSFGDYTAFQSVFFVLVLVCIYG
ncbi:putative membrane protein [Anaplasma phagocytophilum str. Annie]|uniref:Putative membrane protein n=1 Tax=Anaplasma phagocytophilum str. NCH-1 TaxID=1359161 RepID=A0A0F3MUD5_ANAPH|nr:putative membrane protein [Anaplasma phagocytophilum str. NCH-1]KJV60878.1 putative membrane protein [Anaplasma phagocytophilum str. Webster]KJV98026.1 putative membrane protein [Anaplasma phagocytophilum str. Annie]